MTDVLDELEATETETAWIEKRFLFVRGEFQVSKAPFQYFLTQASIEDLDRFFTRMDEIEGSKDWGLRALFQRDLDEDRVTETLVEGYLEQEEKNKFFPPLTIALVPFNEAAGELEERLTEPREEEEEDGKNVINYGDYIKISLAAGGEAGRIVWNRNKTRAVALDGQHRMAALSQYGGRHPNLKDEVTTPITLVILDHEQRVLDQLRELFVDINNNAREVSETRLIILDDRDPFRTFTRLLVADTPEEIERGQDTELRKLPFWVVDWKNEKPRPSESHQVTTLFVLYHIVRRVFQGGKVSALQTELNLNSALEDADLDLVDTSEDSVQLNREQMDVAITRFEERLRPFILGVFWGLDALSEVISDIEHLFSGTGQQGEELRNYLLEPPKQRDEWIRHLPDRGFDPEAIIHGPRAEMNAARLDGAEILYLSIGQRALFSDINACRRVYTDNLPPRELAGVYSDDLNNLVDEGFFSSDYAFRDRSIWDGICYSQGSVMVSNAAANRISSIITLCCHALNFDGDEDVFLQSLEEHGMKGSYNRVKSAYSRIYEQEEEDVDPDVAERRARNFLNDLLISVWKGEL